LATNNSNCKFKYETERLWEVEKVVIMFVSVSATSFIILRNRQRNWYANVLLHQRVL